ncbi:unnamed protein product [Dovyalis caffra]|uniref:Uncharacterized protein n=1 Tax=Dovyalis caffra TaxID=77055 RepID=A0AAV1R7G9_9ROSI|nr:unnamed protein product [Dovyalis caffra]
MIELIICHSSLNGVALVCSSMDIPDVDVQVSVLKSRTGLADPNVHCGTTGSLLAALAAFHFHHHPCEVAVGP